MKIREEMGVSFDDVLLVPRKSDIKSRTDGSIDLSIKLTSNLHLPYPLITAAMDTVTGFEMMVAMNSLGGLGMMHRFQDLDEYLSILSMISASGFPVVATIGLGEKGFDRINAIIKRRIVLSAIHIDVAYAHTPMMQEFIPKIRRHYDEGIYEVYKNDKTVKLFPINIIVGSVATGSGVVDLCFAGADAIRVGVGPGSQCTTRINTGNGVPQVTALMEARKAADLCSDSTGKTTSIICDGGVKNAGDVIKALAAGADAVMSGFLFAGTDETPGEVMNTSKGKCKVYRGMSSKPAQEAWKKDERITSIEGAVSMIPYRGSVVDVFHDLVGNMLSGMSYQGARNIRDLQENAEFIKITAAGMAESKARDK